MKEYGKIYKTKDYTLFKQLEGNRGISRGRINGIIRSIQKVGYITNPIIINENFEIIDGQGRFEACKSLGLPVLYLIHKGAGLDECVSMNVSMKNWETMDFINSYAEQGNVYYQQLLLLADAYKNIPIQAICGLLRNVVVTNGQNMRFIREGELTFTKKRFDMAKCVCELLNLISKELKLIPGSSRLKDTAIGWCVANTSCDPERIISVITNNYSRFRPVLDSSPLLFFEDLENLYNKRLSEEKSIYFTTEYKKALKKNGGKNK